MLSYPGCHVWADHWLYWKSRTCIVKSRHCYVKVMSFFNIVSQGIQEVLEVYLEFDGEQEKAFHYSI